MGRGGEGVDGLSDVRPSPSHSPPLRHYQHRRRIATRLDTDTSDTSLSPTRGASAASLSCFSSCVQVLLPSISLSSYCMPCKPFILFRRGERIERCRLVVRSFPWFPPHHCLRFLFALLACSFAGLALARRQATRAPFAPRRAHCPKRRWLDDAALSTARTKMAALFACPARVASLSLATHA